MMHEGALKVMAGFQQFYQPVVCLESRKIHYHEALLRRAANEGGEALSAATDVSRMEQAGNTVALDSWSIKKAFDYSNSISLDPNQPPIAVNLSGHSLNTDGFSSRVIDYLEQTGCASRINFEITETVPLKNLRAARDFIESVRKLGSKVAIDDFGKGAANEQYLLYLPVDTLKIDGDYIQNINKGGLEFIRAAVALAGKRNIELVAEYVETPCQMNQLRDEGIHYGQGFLFGKAVKRAMNDLDVLINLQKAEANMSPELAQKQTIKPSGRSFEFEDATP